MAKHPKKKINQCTWTWTKWYNDGTKQPTFPVKHRVVVPKDFGTEHVSSPQGDGAMATDGGAAGKLKLLDEPGHFVLQILDTDQIVRFAVFGGGLNDYSNISENNSIRPCKTRQQYGPPDATK